MPTTDAFRIKPDGAKQRINLPEQDVVDDPDEPDNRHWYWVNGLFAEGDATCVLYKDKMGYNETYYRHPVYYDCQDQNGAPLQTKQPTPDSLPDLWDISLTPQLHPATGTLYLTVADEELSMWIWMTRQLWKRDRPTQPGPWERLSAEPQYATLTIQGGTVKDDDWTIRAKLNIQTGAIKQQAPQAVLTINAGTLNEHRSEIEEYRLEVKRDAIGRITQKTEAIDGIPVTQNYTYDQAGRLIETVTDGHAATWGYDANGNRTHQNGTEIATFDAQDRILQQNGTAYQHNPMGQRIGKTEQGQTTTYRYDNLGNLREAKLPDGTEITYAIDAQDRRIGRKENGNWTHKWIYQDGLNPIAELDANDQIRKAFIYADKGHVPAYMITYKEDGSEDKQYRIISDLLGSVRLVYDLTTETEVQRIDYDVWGNITNDTHPDFQPFGFAGGLYDQKTKLTRFGARDYDAETGRWTAKDPIDFEGGDYNLYGYVANDPVNFTDPEGLAPGDKFESVEDVLGDIKKYLPTQKNYRYIEYGGWIYKIDDCSYSYNLLTDEKPTYVQITGTPSPGTPVATWHSHPERAGGALNNFSASDLTNARARGIPNYLFAPNGTVRQYDPSTKRDKKIF